MTDFKDCVLVVSSFSITAKLFFLHFILEVRVFHVVSFALLKTLR